MITDIEIENFRGLESVKIENLKRINIIAGENNTGKTSVLEAVAIAGISEGSQIDKVSNNFRTSDLEYNFWLWLITNNLKKKPSNIKLYCNSKHFEVEINQIETGISVIRDEFQKEQHITQKEEKFRWKKINVSNFLIKEKGLEYSLAPIHSNIVSVENKQSTPNSDAELISRVIASIDGEERLQNLLRKIDNRLRRIRYLKLKENPYPIIYVDVGDTTAIPLHDFGDGFVKIAKIYSFCMEQKASILLIDEMTNGIHHSILETFWKAIFEMCEQEDIQIITTTHSWESLTTAHKVNTARNKDEMAFYRLDRIPTGKIKCTSIPSDSINTALEMNWDLR